MTNRTVLLAIVNALEDQGLDSTEYQLQRVIDVDALEQLVDSATQQTDLEIQFLIGEYRVIVTASEVYAHRR